MIEGGGRRLGEGERLREGMGNWERGEWWLKKEDD